MLYFFLALVVVDNMKGEKMIEDVSSEGSTIDIMSSGDEHIDITNDLDPPETSTVSDCAQEYIFN